MRRDAGFTLVEMLVVLAIIGLSATATVRFVSAKGRGVSLAREATQLEVLLNTARKQAKGASRPIAVDIDIATGAVTTDGGGRLHLTGSSISVRTRRADLGRGGAERIVFFTDGTATGGTITLRRQNRQARLAIDWISGSVTRDGAER